MLGDIVRANGEIGKVDMISKDFIEVNGNRFAPESIVPVEITEELLDANEFVYDGYSWSRKYVDDPLRFGCAIFLQKSPGCWILGIRKFTYFQPISKKYVHELQHIMRMNDVPFELDIKRGLFG